MSENRIKDIPNTKPEEVQRSLSANMHAVGVAR
jgi:hypothetical protein